ncbi:hypothetical protein CEP54_000079 [Fusarium duplospermum]|uniref:Uncharacterized protein n=1 Tax=Fusarium duplospermum TaxID=1325734 RepID=A0A428R7Y3_9HYPO|nr:hypothetical protein CEP54_000079 [Fusarium duplospermum]
MDDPEAGYESLFGEILHEFDLAFMAESLPLNTNTNVNDANFADTPLGMHIPDQTHWLNAPIPDPNDPLLFNFNTPIPIPDIDYTQHQNWYPDMMPALTEDSPSATLNSSSVSEQSPVFSPAYTSPLSTNYSPQEQLLPPSLGPTPTPTPTHASPPKKKPQRRRRTRQNPATGLVIKSRTAQYLQEPC